MRRALLLAVCLLLCSPVARAGARVQVLPSAPILREEQQFTRRVSDERDVATAGIRVVVPAVVTVAELEPEPGWRRQTRLARDRRVREVIYRGGRIARGEYADFHFLGTPFAPGELAWPVYQRYADGKVERWTCPPARLGVVGRETGPRERGPSPATDVTAIPSEPSPRSTGRVRSSAATWLGLIALAIALGSALGVVRLWVTAPGRVAGRGRGEGGRGQDDRGLRRPRVTRSAPTTSSMTASAPT